jgi:hypothetical protein
MLGVNIGQGLIGGNPKENPKGFWEVGSLTDFNEQLLNTLGGTWHNPPNLFEGWNQSSIILRQVPRARTIFKQAHPMAQWVWKDPRNCLLMPFWQQALQCHPVVVIAHRDPSEVVESLKKRNGFDREKCWDLWTYYIVKMLEWCEGKPTYTISYADLLQDPVLEIGELQQFLTSHRVEGLESVPPGNLAGFLDQGLKHHYAIQGDAASTTNRLHLQVLDIFNNLPKSSESFPEYVLPKASKLSTIINNLRG